MASAARKGFLEGLPEVELNGGACAQGGFSELYVHGWALLGGLAVKGEQEGV